MDKPTVVIGAGIGGLSAAIHLAVAGRRVVILEKNPQVGGKMGLYESYGFRWDTGPSVITMRHVFDALFARAGKRFTDYVELIPLEPLTRYFYPDGTVLNASTDIAKMTGEISRLNPKDVEGYLAYLSYAARIHRITGDVFIYDKPPTLRSFTRLPVHEWLHADPFRTMQQAIHTYVQSPHLRQLLGRFATYVGGSPYFAPATLNVIAAIELLGGVWYPKGGIYTIALALKQLAEELGIEIWLNSSVTQIGVQNNQVMNLIMANGSIIETDTVVANVDVTTVYRNLLPSTSAEKLRKLERRETSCSGFVMLLAINDTFPQLAHHNILFSGDYRTEFDSIFKQHRPADNPTIYISITSKTDPSHAPGGGENWFVLVNAPAVSPQWNWDKEMQHYRERVLQVLASRGLDVRDKIRFEKVMTPVDLEQQTGAWRGALYGISPNSQWSAFRRPHNRAPIKGLYFVGGTTHPGGGVPMVTLSGKVAAEMVIADSV